MMRDDSPVLLIGSEADYVSALAELEVHMAHLPARGTPAARRFDRLSQAVLAYEDVRWPLSRQDWRHGTGHV